MLPKFVRKWGSFETGADNLNNDMNNKALDSIEEITNSEQLFDF